MYKLFSVDDHILEPPTLWGDRVPRKYRELAPHVVSENGKDVWHYDGRVGQSTGLFAVAGKPPEEWNSDPRGYSEMTRGCYDPKTRAADFLSNGVCASVSFPTQCGFGGELFLGFKDRDLASVCIEAYNDFMIDEWCASGPPGLYVPTILTKLWDPEAAAKEIYRCAAKGAKTLSFVENAAVKLGLPSFWTPHWDPVWRACEETGMPICMHIGSGFDSANTAVEAPSTLPIALGNIGAQRALVDFSMSPVCRKFSKLQLVFSEGGFGWIPAALERADRQFTRHAAWTKLTGMLPSEIFQRNMNVCMIYEPVALHSVRHLVGIDRILWELDYPHADTPWPDAQAEVREQFADVPADECDRILWKNAEKLFNWTSAELPTVALAA